MPGAEEMVNGVANRSAFGAAINQAKNLSKTQQNGLAVNINTKSRADRDKPKRGSGVAR